MQGSGGFSYLANRIRARRNLPTVQSLVRAPIVWLDANLELKKKEKEDEARKEAKASRLAAKGRSSTTAAPPESSLALSHKNKPKQTRTNSGEAERHVLSKMSGTEDSDQESLPASRQRRRAPG